MASRLPLSHVQLLYRALNHFGRRTAVVNGPLRFTYAEFVERCEGMAGELLQRGVQPGETVAFRSFNTHRMLEAYFAPALIGAVFLPINARLADAEVRAILDHAKPQFFWTEPFPAIDHAERVMPPDFDESRTAALFYTSGTTGEPKPVRLSHRNLYLHALALSAACQRRQDAVELQVIPLFHANGWGRPLMSVLNGNRIVLQRRFNPAEMLRLIEEEGVTDIALVPTMARDLLARGEGFGRSSLREIHLGGSPVPPDLIAALERTFGCRVTVGYGMTEANSAIAYDGVPLPGLEVQVEGDGEIWLRGETVAAEGWFATGDLGRWTNDGRLEVVGRKKDIIVSGGENISAREVEEAINAHPDVLESAVVGVPDERWGEVPIAFVVLKSTTSKPGLSPLPEGLSPLPEGLSPSPLPGLSRFLRERIAGFKIPHTVYFRTELLPRNGAGKIATGVLREEHRAAAPSREAEAVQENHVDVDLS